MRTAAAALLATGLLLVSCGETSGKSALPEDPVIGSLELEYADQFQVDLLEDGCSLIQIGDGLRYLLVPEGQEVPEWMGDEAAADLIVLRQPLDSVYLAASSGMDLVKAIDALGEIHMTSTQASDWADPEIREAVENDRIHYVGKYRAPDYEALIEDGTDLAIESTMIYHTPQIREELEDLGIPVLVERSSYETDPLGRLEWIKLYGLLFGREKEAEAVFEREKRQIGSIRIEDTGEPAQTAFFYVSAGGSVIVRKPGDYVTKMIEMAGGTYALDDVLVEEENAVSTMNLQMEAFYESASDADCLIYNSSIEGDLQTIGDLCTKSELFRDFKAVRSGNVWCTNRNMFQQMTGTGEMIEEMNRIFRGETDGTDLKYFHRLRQ